MRERNTKEVVAAVTVPKFDAKRCYGEIYKVDMVTRHASQIADIARKTRNGQAGKEEIIEKYAQSFAARLLYEPCRLCGNDEYLHPEDVSELLAISAVSEGLRDKADGELRRKLDDISDKAFEIAFDNIPTREIEEASSILSSFSEYVAACMCARSTD